jgi:ectoine hydroxylase-related dioxygenase (phytanoyl-CoA dioxygenase family)
MITSFQPTDAVDDIAAVLDEEGVVIVERIVPGERLGRLLLDLQPYLDAVEPGGGSFFGRRAKRISAILAKSPVYAELICEPLLLALAGRMLGRNCARFQIQATAVLQVWEGGQRQPLHRDRDTYAPYLAHVPGGPEHVMSLMWAGTDFTAANGATHFVRGSHMTTGDGSMDLETDRAVMPAGSVAVWRGSLLHGMGVNTTSEPRTGIVGGYSVGWLRQEENQYLACPPEVARAFPPEVQRLIGYRSHSPVLGWVEGADPDLLLAVSEPVPERRGSF